MKTPFGRVTDRSSQSIFCSQRIAMSIGLEDTVDVFGVAALDSFINFSGYVFHSGQFQSRKICHLHEIAIIQIVSIKNKLQSSELDFLQFGRV